MVPPAAADGPARLGRPPSAGGHHPRASRWPALGRLAGVAAVVALVAHAALGLQVTHRLAVDGVDIEERTNASSGCLEAALRARLPPDAVVGIVPTDLWWIPQQLTEWVSPDWELAGPGSETDVWVELVQSEAGCAGIDVAVTRP